MPNAFKNTEDLYMYTRSLILLVLVLACSQGDAQRMTRFSSIATVDTSRLSIGTGHHSNEVKGRTDGSDEENTTCEARGQLGNGLALDRGACGSFQSAMEDTSKVPTAEALPQAPAPVRSTPPPHTTSYSFPSFEERRARYIYDFIGPGTFIGAGIGALVDQTANLKVAYPGDGAQGTGLHPAHGTVPEWGEGFGGYSKRYASEFGTILTSVTLRYGLGEALREDVLYHRCQCTGLLPRTRHAFAESFIARTRSGRKLPSLPVLVSPFIASEVAVSAWYPHRYDVSDAFRISGISYYLIPLKNMLKEFTGK